MGFTLYDSLSSVNLEATHVAVFVKLNLWLLEHFKLPCRSRLLKVIRKFARHVACKLLP